MRNNNQADTGQMLMSGQIYWEDPQANTRRWRNVVLMLGQRRRRCANINTTLRQRFVFAGASGVVLKNWYITDLKLCYCDPQFQAGENLIYL